MDFENWLAQYKKRREADCSGDERQAFTRSVMDRIRAEESAGLSDAPDPFRRRHPLLTWRFALGGACAAIVVAVFLLQAAPDAPPELAVDTLSQTAPVAVPLERQVRQDLELLAELDALDSDVAEADLELLAAEVDEMLLLAEDAGEAEELSWVEDIIELYRAAGEEDELYEVLPDEFLLEELEVIDEVIVSAGGIRG